MSLRPAVIGVACCLVAAAVLYLGGLYGHPAACALPLLLLLLIIIEYPPPGSGVGLPAAPLSHLQPIAGTVPLGVDGALEAGCAYTIIFWRGNKQGYTALPKLERLWRRCTAAAPNTQGGMNFVIVSVDAKEQLQDLAKKWEGQLTVPVMHDDIGEATHAYVARHQVLVLPQAFVVGPHGKITWHGHTSNRGLAPALAKVMRQLAVEDGVTASAGAQTLRRPTKPETNGVASSGSANGGKPVGKARRRQRKRIK